MATMLLISYKYFVIFLQLLSSKETYGNIVASRWTSPEKLSLFVQKNNSLTESSYKTLQTNPRITGIAIDHKKHSLFLYMSLHRTIEMVKNFDGTFNNQQSFDLVRTGVSNGYGSVAFDWLTENLYWTDSMYNWIAMQPAYSKDDSMFKILVSDGLERPEGLAIDPLSRYLFWSDTSDRDKIERSSLSGTQRTLLVFKSLKRIFSMEADIDTQRLYWVDYSRTTLEFCDYNGRNRHIVSRNNGYFPTGFVIYSKFIFVVMYEAGEIFVFDKKTEEYKKSIKINEVRVIGLLNTTVHEQVGMSRCDNTKCPHMCVNVASNSSLCVCKEGFQYLPSTNVCRPTTNYFSKGIVLTDGSRICMVTILVVSNGTNTQRCTYIGSSLVGAIVVQRERIIYHEKTTNNLNFIQIYGQRITGTLARNVGSISDIEYDWVDEKLLWIDDEISSIKIADANDPSEATIVAINLREPRLLTIDVHEKVIYWSALDDNGGPSRRIYKCNFTGGNVSTFESLVSFNPKGLFFDSRTDRLFWIDGNEIKSIRTNGSDFKSYDSTGMDSRHLLIFQDYAVWTNSSPAIFSKCLSTKGKTYASSLSELMSVKDMAIYDSNLWKGKKGKCTIDNGGCEQICLPENPTRKCACKFGFTLQRDGKSCSSGLPMQSFALICDAGNDVIYQMSLNASVIQGIKIHGLDIPLAVEYHPGLNRIFIPEYTGELKSTTIDGDDVSTLLQTGSSYPSDVEIDISNNQIYFTVAIKNSDSNASYVGVIRIDTHVHKTLVRGLWDPRSLAIHPGRGILFWTDMGSVEHIGRSSMDGKDKATIISTDITWPRGIAIDYKANVLYWSDMYENKIESCDFFGGNRRKVLVDKGAYISRFIIRESYIYYTGWNKRKVTKADKRTGQIVPWMSDHPEFGRLDAVDIFPKDITPESLLCKTGNGDCSTFCFPTARSRVCGCEDGVNLLSDRKRCENVEICPEITIQNGRLSSTCLRYANHKCDFTCNAGFVPRDGLSNVTCNPLGRWMEVMDNICEEEKLPESDQHVKGKQKIIIGASVGGGVLIIVMVTVLLIVLRRCRRTSDNTYVSYAGGNSRKSDGSTYAELNF